MIAGSGARSNGEYVGIAPGANIYDVQVLDSRGNGRLSSVIAGLDWLPARAEMEYHHPILPGDRLRLACQLSAGRADLWLLNDHARLASAQLNR